MTVPTALVVLAILGSGAAQADSVLAPQIADASVGSWYAMPDPSNEACAGLQAIPWCNAAEIPTVVRFFEDIGAPLQPLDPRVASTVAELATCWINLHNFGGCSDQMCFAAGKYPLQKDSTHPIMVITVYTDHPATNRDNVRSVSAYELGPVFYFNLQPLQWLGPPEKGESAQPCD